MHFLDFELQKVYDIFCDKRHDVLVITNVWKQYHKYDL